MILNRKQIKAQSHQAIDKHLICLTLLPYIVATAQLVLRLKTRSLYSWTENVTVILSPFLGPARGGYSWAEIGRAAGIELLRAALHAVIGIFNMGYTGACLRVSRGQSVKFGDLFGAFRILFKAAWLWIAMDILINLWSLLELVANFYIGAWSLLFSLPGLVASFCYALAPVVLMGDPGKPVMDCIRESRRLIWDHKGEMLVLDLSLSGWFLLFVIPFGALYVMPYFRLVQAKCYDTLSGYKPAKAKKKQHP